VLQAELDSTSTANVAASGDLETALAELAAKEAALEEATAASANYQAQLAVALTQRDEFGVRAEASEAQIAALKSDTSANLDDLKLALAAKEAAEADRLGEIEALNTSLVQTKEAGARLEIELEALKTQRGTEAEELERLQGELTAALEAQSATAADLAVVTEAQEVQVATLTSEIEALRGRLERANAGGAAPATFIDNCAAVVDAQLSQTTVNFATSTATLTRDSQTLLERISGMVLACANDGVDVEIGGHTDARGSDEANMTLSEARANVVRNFLIERGVNESNLSAVGFGETQPIASNDTTAGRAANRRISLEWRLN